MSINAAKRTLFFSLCASRMTSFFALHLVQWPRWQLLELLPFLVHCRFRIRNFHRLRQRDKLVHQVIATYRIEPFFRDLIIMISWLSGFQPISRGFMSFRGACIVKWRFPKVDRVRSRYQSVSRERQADMDDMGMKRGAANERDRTSKAKQGCVLSHANA